MNKFNLFHKNPLPASHINNHKKPYLYFIDILVIMFLSSLLSGILLYVIQTLFAFKPTSEFETLYLLFSTGITILIVLFYQRKDDQRDFYSFGLIKENYFQHYFLGHCIGLIMFSSVILIAYLCKGAIFKGFVLKAPLILLLYFMGFMIQGFEEELICRGYMMYGLSKNKSTFYAIMINSLFFGFLHIGNDGVSILAIINIILVGIVFSLFAIYFDDLWVVSGIHSMWNFAQGCIYGINVSGIDISTTIFQFELQGPHFISGGLFGLEGSIVTTIVLVCVMLILCLKYDYKK